MSVTIPCRTRNQQWLADRMTAIEARIIAYEEALANLASGVIQQYSLNTGQDIQMVTRQNTASIERVIQSLYNQLSVLENRAANCSNVITTRPRY